jgi:hypothetical protein
VQIDPLTSSIVHLLQARNLSQVQYAVAAKILDTTRDNGQAAIALIEAAGQQAQSAAAEVAAATTQVLDVYA